MQAEDLEQVIYCKSEQIGVQSYAWSLNGTIQPILPAGMEATFDIYSQTARLTLNARSTFNNTVIQCKPIIPNADGELQFADSEFNTTLQVQG